MSVATRNPFALLDEDGTRPPTPPPAPAPQPVQDSPAPAKRSRGGPAARAGRYYPRGGSRQHADRDPPSSEDPPASQDAKQRRPDGDRRDSRGRGRGGNRGGRGRTFDRHSATGKTDSDKKIHNGWGGDDGNAELKTEEAATFDVAAESGNLNDWGAPPTESVSLNDWGAPPTESAGLNDWGAPPADTSAGDWGPAPEEGAPEQSQDTEKPDSARRKDSEDEDNTLTLDQYLARQKESVLLPKLETRKANDGLEVWDGATRLKKGHGEAYFSGKSKSAPKARTEKKEKIFIEIDAHFERPSRGGRGRGADRGEGRGRGARGRGNRGRGAANGAYSPAVNVDDTIAFPSLS